MYRDMSDVNFKIQNTCFQQIMHDKWTKVMRYVSKYLFATDRCKSNNAIIFSNLYLYINMFETFFFTFLFDVWLIYTQDILFTAKYMYDGPAAKHCLRQCISNLKLVLYLAITRQLTLKFQLTIEMSYLYNHCKH